MPTPKRKTGAPDAEMAVDGRVTDDSRFEAFYKELYGLARTLASQSVDGNTAEEIVVIKLDRKNDADGWREHQPESPRQQEPHDQFAIHQIVTRGCGRRRIQRCLLSERSGRGPVTHQVIDHPDSEDYEDRDQPGRDDAVPLFDSGRFRDVNLVGPVAGTVRRTLAHGCFATGPRAAAPRLRI